MATILIPKNLSPRDVVVIPKREYRKLLELKKIGEFNPTPAQKRSLAKAEKNLKEGKTLSYNELVKKLGNKD